VNPGLVSAADAAESRTPVEAAGTPQVERVEHGAPPRATPRQVPREPARPTVPFAQTVAAADPSSSLLRDLAVASLVPTMGRVINLPSESPTETIPHRLMRVGHAPAVVERHAAAPAGDATEEELALAADLPAAVARWMGGVGTRREGIVSGPLPLLQARGQVPDSFESDLTLPSAGWLAGFPREAAVVRGGVTSPPMPIRTAGDERVSDDAE
jgi:hypothetical protein